MIENMQEYVRHIRAAVSDRLDLTREVEDDEIREVISQIVAEESRQNYLSLGERQTVIETVFNSMRGLDVLQPLVENAIYHGLKYKETKGNLDIRGYRRGNRVCLVVADDGAGMEESELEHILEKKEKKTKSNGVGVYNVQKRLQLYYGPEYGISYISRKGEGTVATVTIPLDGGKSNEETGR